ncbi:asparagine synthase (glutamine-hydrolyzing) [bacterium]|jgi:asparagine synthase (glutamine-hydrolysing)|nr:asparagine synthase (glutamine-hydrolyzing) [bacterium]
MCGITGLFDPNGIDGDTFYKAHRLIAHRGPDDEGFMALNGTAPTLFRGEDTISHFKSHPHVSTIKKTALILGHRRLSIIDLSENGHQPISYKGLWLTYNGELYNYRELRDELISCGYTFQTKSDSEVFLKAYHYWGVSAFERFIGMWAAAIYDASANDIILTRDMFGIKPLYYGGLDNRFCFASEIKVLLSLDPTFKTVDKTSIYDFIRYDQKDHSENTFFKDVKQLLPGHYLRLTLATGKRFTQKWAPARSRNAQKMTPLSVRKLIDDSIALHLRSDVKLGISLSGGIDSSVIAGSVAKNQSIEAFSAVFPENSAVDESQYIYATVDHYSPQINLNTVSPSFEDAFSLLDPILFHMDEPFRTLAMVLPFRIYEDARNKGVSVMLGGQGGDELFAGYRGHERDRCLSLLKEGRLISWYHSVQQTFPTTKAFFRWAIANHSRIYWLFWSLSLKKSLRQLLPKKKISYFESQKIRRPFSLRSQYFNYGLRDYLTNDDRMSMASSVEARVPFLNPLIYQESIAHSTSTLMPGNVRKHWLKEAYREVLIPEVLNRKDKMGYLYPESDWINTHRDQLIESIDNCPLFKDCRKDIQATVSISENKLWRVFIVSRWFIKMEITL